MRYKLTLEYDGTPFSGWQKQDDRPSVQTALEDAILAFCGTRCGVVGAGRTDAGVHATAQVAHVDLPKEYDTFTVTQAINFHLVPSSGHASAVVILHAEPVSEEFHARFSATQRSYLYRILNRRSRPALHANRVWHVPTPLDEHAMQAAANVLLGHHDFTSFRDAQCQAKSPMKTLESLTVTRIGDEIRIETFARSFLHHQVRIMVGTLANAGSGKWSAEEVKSILEAKDRNLAGPTIPPGGLYLTGVGYGAT